MSKVTESIDVNGRERHWSVHPSNSRVLVRDDGVRVVRNKFQHDHVEVWGRDGRAVMRRSSKYGRYTPRVWKSMHAAVIAANREFP